jgi:choline dehydrogenase-like flavoprotein
MVEKLEKTEVIIVGAGAAGSVMAAVLAEAGRRVVVLEAGPARRLDGLVSSQIWARRNKWVTPAVIEAGAQKIGHNFNAGFGLGGAALHHYGVWPRLHEDDFIEHSRFGQGLDWPLTYDELRPFYDEIQRQVGLAGDAAAEVWRPPGAPYPLPPLEVLEQGRTLARGFTALGLRTAPIPMAVLSRDHQGRPACIYDGWCDAGCPTGALANPLVTYLPRARQAGAELRADCAVLRVLTDRKGGRAEAVDYVDGDGVRRRLYGDLIVLAAFAVQTPRLLLNSASAAHPDGLANRNGLVGAYVMTHPATSVSGLFDHQTEPYMGLTGGQLICQDGYAKDGYEAGFGSGQWLIGLALKPNGLLGMAMSRADLFGAALDDFMHRAAGHMATMVSVSEDLPQRENRVTISSKKDKFGMPLAHVVHNTHEASLARWRLAVAQGRRIIKAAGAREVWNGPLAPMHLMGGTIMGRKPATSVTNSYGQTHEVPNLMIAGPGLFPTSGAVNPTFTVHALALRAARRALADWSAIVR